MPVGPRTSARRASEAGIVKVMFHLTVPLSVGGSKSQSNSTKYTPTSRKVMWPVKPTKLHPMPSLRKVWVRGNVDFVKVKIDGGFVYKKFK